MAFKKSLLLVICLGLALGLISGHASASEPRLAYFRLGKLLTTDVFALEVTKIERSIILNTGGYPSTDSNGYTRLAGCVLLADDSEAARRHRLQENGRLRKLLPIKKAQRDLKIEAAVKVVAAKKSLSAVLTGPLLYEQRNLDITDDILAELKVPSVQDPNKRPFFSEPAIGVLEMKLLMARYAESPHTVRNQHDLSQDIERLAEQLDLKMVLDKRVIFLGGLDLTPRLLETLEQS